MGRAARQELKQFHDLNVTEKTTGKKVPWPTRYALICLEFPAADKLDWREAFRDIDLFGRVLRDILRVDQVRDSSGGPGRPVLDHERAAARLNQLRGNDYAYEEFPEAFSTLCGNRSIRHIARILDMNVKITWELKNGKKHPDIFLLERIATAFGKDPSYFVEYRMSYILAALGFHLDGKPETTVDLYKRIKGERHGSHVSN